MHPDRNFNNVEAATRDFAEVQAAYEVLSDPHERAWYDSHRDAILSGQNGSFDDVAGTTTYRNIHLTSTAEIISLMSKFNTTIPFTDAPLGFFSVVRETFDHLALEEEVVAENENLQRAAYPTFGSSQDDYYEVVRPFYYAWAGFATRKTFSWKDKYRVSDAPDRRIRRSMEKENKKNRIEAAREFNEAVRFLVAFVRKRDPRYISNMQSDAERQTSLRIAAAAQAARSRAANQEKVTSYEVPEWARSRFHEIEQDQLSTSGDDSEIEILECVVCNKNFKSARQLEAHERSKKHTKALQQLRRQMKKEGVDFKLDTDATPLSPDQLKHESSDTLPSNSTERKATQGLPYLFEASEGVLCDVFKTHSINNIERPEADANYIPELVKDHLGSTLNCAQVPQLASGNDFQCSIQELTLGDAESPVRVGKAKAKREKKTARRALENEVISRPH